MYLTKEIASNVWVTSTSTESSIRLMPFPDVFRNNLRSGNRSNYWKSKRIVKSSKPEPGTIFPRPQPARANSARKNFDTYRFLGVAAVSTPIPERNVFSSSTTSLINLPGWGDLNATHRQHRTSTSSHSFSDHHPECTSRSASASRRHPVLHFSLFLKPRAVCFLARGEVVAPHETWIK